MLLERLLNDPTDEAIEEAFKRHAAMNEDGGSKQGGAMSGVYECKQCFLAGKEYMLPPACFGADEPSQILDLILKEGAWSRCRACQEVAKTKRAARGLPPSASLEHAYAGADDLSCGERVHLCGICNLNKRAARFSPSMVKHAQRNKTMVCNACEAMQCKECGTVM